MTRNTRIFVLLLTLVAMLGVSVISASPFHSHSKAQAASCEICFSAHVAASETPLVFSVYQPVLCRRDKVPVLALHYEEQWFQPHDSRGPPASL